MSCDFAVCFEARQKTPCETLSEAIYEDRPSEAARRNRETVAIFIISHTRKAHTRNTNTFEYACFGCRHRRWTRVSAGGRVIFGAGLERPCTHTLKIRTTLTRTYTHIHTHGLPRKVCVLFTHELGYTRRRRRLPTFTRSYLLCAYTISMCLYIVLYG